MGSRADEPKKNRPAACSAETMERSCRRHSPATSARGARANKRCCFCALWLLRPSRADRFSVPSTDQRNDAQYAPHSPHFLLGPLAGTRTSEVTEKLELSARTNV